MIKAWKRNIEYSRAIVRKPCNKKQTLKFTETWKARYVETAHMRLSVNDALQGAKQERRPCMSMPYLQFEKTTVTF